MNRSPACATQAAQAALDHAGWAPEDLDLILLATSSPDDLFGTAPRVQAALGAKRAVAFDLTAACSGFLVCPDHRPVNTWPAAPCAGPW
jgi:3-oxoacyl-[acyl-carrier-protein] synthase III